jgi:peroxiredoxin
LFPLWLDKRLEVKPPKLMITPSNQQSSLQRISWLVAASIITITAVFSLNACAAEPALEKIEPGMPAPVFQLESARGNHFSSLEQPKQVLLLSFINTQADPTAEQPDPSRSQVAFLKSMHEQYGGKGVKVLIVDASQLITRVPVQADDLLNFTYNWSLEDQILVLIDDQDNTTARNFGVSQLPTTFLIDSNNTVVQRWDGYASAAQLAFALQELVGGPVHRDENFPIQPKGSAVVARCPQVTPAQAKFAGLAPARSLSDQIWVVDSGQNWGIGASWPLQWIILADSKSDEHSDLRLSVNFVNMDTGETQELVDQVLQLVPPDESHGFLMGLSDPKPIVYMLTQSVHLESSGCYQLDAVVTQETQQKSLFSGTGFIQAGD